MRIGVLSNLKAGGSGARAGTVLEHLARFPDIVHVETDSSHSAPEAMRELASANVGILVVNGGDGTLQRTLTEVLCESSPFRKTGDVRELPLIAPLRTGRTCMSAYDIGSPRDARMAIDRLASRVRHGRIQDHVVHRAALRMKLTPDGVDHWGMFFGVGVIYRGTLLTHRMFPKGKAQGVFGSTVVTAGLIARALTGRAPLVQGDEEDPLTIDPMNVVLDGNRLDAGEFQLLMATTLHRLFAGIRPFWGKGPGGIRFTALAPGCFRRPQEIARLLRGRAPKYQPGAAGASPYESHNVEKVELSLDCGISLDGEMFTPQPGREATLSADHRVRFLSTR